MQAYADAASGESPRADGGRWNAALDLFHADTAWRWQVQLKAERLISPVRATVVAVNTAVWALRPHPPGSLPGLAWAIVVAAWCYVPVDLLMVYRRNDLASRLPAGSTILDVAFILAWIAATGLRHSPFLPLIFLGGMTAPLRLSTYWSLVVDAVYAFAYALLAVPGERFAGAYVLLGGMTIAAWTAVTRNDRQASLRDPLTGCFGRGYAVFHIEQAMVQQTDPFCLGLLDLDGFKRINDTYGHGAGDAVLQQTGHVLAATVREGDVVARYGGDEFLLLLAHADAETGRAVAERVRAAVEQAPFHVHAAHAAEVVVPLTASVGLAEAAWDATAPRLIGLADRSLYEAKRLRNCVVVARGAGGRSRPVRGGAARPRSR